MRKKALVHYFGNDPDLVQEMEKFFSMNPGFDLKVENYAPASIMAKITGPIPLIIIIDFSLTEDPHSVIEEVIYYKRMNPYKATLFAGIFASKKNQSDLSLIFSSGFQYSFIKGCETELFLKDLLQLSTLEERGAQRFAEAKNINRPMPVGICSSVSELSEMDYTIETDLPLCQDNLTSALPFVNESRPQQLKISSQDEASYLYPMSTQCKVEHPFASPWDTVTDEMLDPETIKTWISDNAHSLIAHREFIKVISQNKELHLELYNKSSLLSLHLDSTIDLSSHWPAEMNTRRPALIFFDSDTMEEDKIPLIEEFITLIKSTIDYRPIIIISRTETAGPAFQKVFNYPMILSLPQPLEFGIIANLAQTYLKRKGSNLNSLNSYAFKNSDPRRAVDVVFSPVINKLTEHSIDLYSPLEIPFYSVLHFKIPLDFYATITPSKSPTEQRGNNFYYHCLIHGVDEKQVSRLRQFVNQLIYSPIEDFSEESIKKTSEVKVVEEKPVIVKATAPDPVKIEHHNWDEARKQIKGKSKL